jgi:hypothetical protein
MALSYLFLSEHVNALAGKGKEQRCNFQESATNGYAEKSCLSEKRRGAPLLIAL